MNAQTNIQTNDPTVFVVETPVFIKGGTDDGKYAGKFQHYVADEERARTEAAKAEGRTYRPLPLSAVPEKQRANLARVLGVAL
jgi:hypothetical protein